MLGTSLIYLLLVFIYIEGTRPWRQYERQRKINNNNILLILTRCYGLGIVPDKLYGQLMAKTKSKKLDPVELGYGEPDCAKCKLRAGVKVVGWGADGAAVMLVLPNPVQTEATNPEEQLPGFLRKVLLRLADIDFKACYGTYACSCTSLTDNPPTATMLKACSARLLAEIEWHDPDMVITFGAPAQKALLPDYPLPRYHGKKIDLGDRIYVPMYDPHDTFDSATLNDVVIVDFKYLNSIEPVKEVTGNYSIEDQEMIIPEDELITVDTETVGLYGKLLGGAVSIAPGEATYMPYQTIVDNLNKMPRLHMLCHNTKYDKLVLDENGLRVPDIELEDTQILAYCMNYDVLRLKVLGTQELNLTWTDYDKLAEKGTLLDVEMEETAQYCCQDTDVTRRLWDYLHEHADKRELHLYNTLEKLLLPRLIEMEQLGIQVDIPYVQKWVKELQEQEEEAIGTICSEYDITPDLLTSPKQLGEWLVGQGVTLPRTGKSLQAATGKEILTPLMDGHPAIKMILNQRQIHKQLSTYAQPILDLVRADGRIHTQYNQTKVITGRLSSSEPNLQNLPYLEAARRPYIARDGCTLLRVDYSQVDMRALAVMSNDPVLLECFEKGEDIHNWMSDKLFGNHDPHDRHIIKSASYLSLYGGTANGLHTYLNSPMGEFDLDKMGNPPSLQECKEIIKTYYERFSGIKDYHERTIAKAHETGYVEDWYGHRRYLPQLSSTNRSVLRSGERQAINMPVAGTAAKIFKVSIVEASRVRVPVLNVHDELVFEIPDDKMAEEKPKIIDAMQNLDFPIPMKTEAQTGKHLGELF